MHCFCRVSIAAIVPVIALSPPATCATLFFASGTSIITTDEVTGGSTGEQVITNTFTVPEFNTNWGVLTSAEYEIDCTGFVGFSVDENTSTMGESASLETCVEIDIPSITVCGDDFYVADTALPPFDVQLTSNDYYPNGEGALSTSAVDNGGYIQFTATTTYSLSAGQSGGQNHTTRMSGGWFAQGGVEYIFTPALLGDIGGTLSGGQIVPDGVVGGADWTVVVDNFGLGTPSVGGFAYYNDGDLNGDGMVTAADLTIVNDNWGNTAP